MNGALRTKRIFLIAGVGLLLAAALCFAGCRMENADETRTTRMGSTTGTPAQTATEDLRDRAETAADKISEGVSQVGENVREDVSNAGEKVSNGVSRANDALEEGATRVSEAVSDLMDGRESTAPNADD